jgi:large subunit ribosomal protein L23
MLQTSSSLRTFWRPLHGFGKDRFELDQGKFYRPQATWMYQHVKMDEKPVKKLPKNPYFGARRLWNAIPGGAGIVFSKTENWGFPYRQPPPTGLRQSQEYFPHFMSKFFPDVTCRLLIDSVLNNETRSVVFQFPPDLSKQEIANYLRSVYGMDNVLHVSTRNYSGRRYKNEMGTIRQMPDVKVATVILSAPVKIEFKQVKGTDDASS